MRRQFIVFLTTILLSCSLSTALAENRANTFAITPFLGGYTFDSSQNLKTYPVAGGRAGYNFTDAIGAEAVFDVTRTKFKDVDEYLTAFNYHLDLLYHFFPSSKAVPFLMAGYGGITLDGEETERSRGAFNYGLGLKYALNDNLHLRGEVRHIIYRAGEDLNNFEYGIGLGFPFGLSKRTPEPVAAPAPAPAPAAAAPAVTPPTPAGTISAAPSQITRGAAITISWDCKDSASADIEPGIGTVAPQGKKSVTPGETTTYKLTCSGPGGKSTAETKVVVSEPDKPFCTLSTDQEVITEGQAATLSWECKNTTSVTLEPGIGVVPPKGSRNVTPAETTTYTVQGAGAGAAATNSVTVKVNPLPPEKRTITLDVRFDTGKAVVQSKYHDEIGRVAAMLKEFPGITGTIEGHTDNVGSEQMNMKLSQRRADAVLNYLVTNFGIERSRLKAVGYGPTKPIADNATAEGRKANRRTVASFEVLVPKKK